jgi:NADH:ubiquinone oxidoreductase subunit 5 (subunit L)/multisubunit Na+/H+ antiporter MnhA subunit
MLVNRVGDVGLALGISIIFIEFKSIDYAVVFGLVPLAANNCYSFLLFNIDKLTIISFLLF